MLACRRGTRTTHGPTPNMIRLWRAPYTTCWWRTLVRYAAALDSSRAAVLNLSVQVALKMQISNLDPTQLCVIGVGLWRR